MPPLPPQPPPGLAAPGQKPSSITVFGILDLVFCVFSIFGAVLGFVGAMSTRILAHPSEKIPVAPAWSTFTAAGISGVVGVLLLLAGLQLIRSRRNAVKWSNCYAWSAIAGKLVGILLNILVYLPMAQSALNSVDSTTRGPVQMGMAIGVVLGGLATMVYPVLCLVFLNRPVVKEWLATCGTGA